MSVVTECPLCGERRKLTNEDLEPIWLRNVVLQLVGQISGPAPARLKIRICGTCNSSLGRRFEAKAAPLIKPMVMGERVQLTPREQVTVSWWIVKTALLGLLIKGYMNDGWRQLLSRQIGRMILTDSVIPSGTSVRLVRVEESGQAPAWPDPNNYYAPHLMPRVGLYGVSYYHSFGYELLTGEPNELQEFISNTSSDRFVRIWPPTKGSVQWPPLLSFHPEELDRLRETWGFVRDRTVPGPFNENWEYESGEKSLKRTRRFSPSVLPFDLPSPKSG